MNTSVIGGCFDAEFVTWSDALMRDFRKHYQLRAVKNAVEESQS